MAYNHIERLYKQTLLKYLKRFPAVGIVGARQVGKTDLAKQIITETENARYFDLESPEDIAALQNPQLLLRSLSNQLVVLDEVQRMPDLFPVLRSLIDEDRRPGRFLLLGSAKPSLMRSSGESLAGRIAYLHLTGILQSEAKEYFTQNELWIRGGFPEPLRDTDKETRQVWFRSFLATYIHQDLPALGLDTSIALDRLMTMLAWQQGGLLNVSELARSLGSTQPTVQKAINWLEDTFLVRRLLPYHVNIGKRVTKSPKTYLRDSGLHLYLLGLDSMENLLSHPQLGLSWEGYAIEQIAGVLPQEYSLHFYRTQKGADCDLLLMRNGVPLVAIDFKISPGKVERGFFIAKEDTKAQKGFMIYASPFPMTPLAEDIWGCDLDTFLGELNLI
jgi:predicted AAA+ superfamily ATPase